MTARVAVVIPCYRATAQVGAVVENVLACDQALNELCRLQVIVVNDGCPECCWQEVPSAANVQVIHHQSNQGVGAATLSGLRRSESGVHRDGETGCGWPTSSALSAGSCALSAGTIAN